MAILRIDNRKMTLALYDDRRDSLCGVVLLGNKSEPNRITDAANKLIYSVGYKKPRGKGITVVTDSYHMTTDLVKMPRMPFAAGEKDNLLSICNLYFKDMANIKVEYKSFRTEKHTIMYAVNAMKRDVIADIYSACKVIGKKCGGIINEGDARLSELEYAMNDSRSSWKKYYKKNNMLFVDIRRDTIKLIFCTDNYVLNSVSIDYGTQSIEKGCETEFFRRLWLRVLLHLDRFVRDYPEFIPKCILISANTHYKHYIDILRDMTDVEYEMIDNKRLGYVPGMMRIDKALKKKSCFKMRKNEHDRYMKKLMKKKAFGERDRVKLSFGRQYTE